MIGPRRTEPAARTPRRLRRSLPVARACGKPLVHQITNYVVMNETANATLALGALPVMAHAREEVEEMVGLAGALVINIGTLSAPWIESMLVAGKAASARGIPVVLDPVGAGATRLRTDTARRILYEADVTVLRGNPGEVATLVGVEAEVRGVESIGSGVSAAEIASEAARRRKLLSPSAWQARTRPSGRVAPARSTSASTTRSRRSTRRRWTGARGWRHESPRARRRRCRGRAGDRRPRDGRAAPDQGHAGRRRGRGGPLDPGCVCRRRSHIRRQRRRRRVERRRLHPRGRRGRGRDPRRGGAARGSSGGRRRARTGVTLSAQYRHSGVRPRGVRFRQGASLPPWGVVEAGRR